MILAAYALLGLRKKQLVTCHLVQISLYIKRSLKKMATKLFYVSVLIFSLCLYVYLSSQKVRLADTKLRVFCTVQYTVLVPLVF